MFSVDCEFKFATGFRSQPYSHTSSRIPQTQHSSLDPALHTWNEMMPSTPHRHKISCSLIRAFCLQVISNNIFPTAKWLTYIAAKVDANNHNEEMLAQLKKTLLVREMKS